jgi:hypothetical protein
MKLKFGKHEGKNTEQILLSDPDFVIWMRSNRPNDVVTSVCNGHIATLDKKKLIRNCGGCGAPATRVSVYRENASGFEYWCDDCNPYSLGAHEGTLSIVRTFDDAMRHIDWTCSGRKADRKTIIRKLAEAKGLASKAKAPEVVAFFAN